MLMISRLLCIFGILVLVCTPSYSTTVDSYHREIRATSDEIGTWVERTSLVARVLNGIALQAGLMSKQIPIDDAVAELLNFGNVSLSQVSGIQVDKVTALITLLKSSQGSLAVTQEIIDIEELTLVFIDIIKESVSIGDIKSVPRIDEYFSSLESRSQQTLPVIDEVDKKFVEVLELLEKVMLVSNYRAKKQLEKLEDTKTLVNVLEKGKELQKYINKTITALKDLEQRKIFADAVSIFQPIATTIKLMSSRSESPDVTLSTENKDAITKQVDIMAKASTAAGEVTWKLTTLRIIIEGRLYSQKQQRKFTNGLAGGVSDLEKLAEDLKDPWLNQTLRRYGDLSKLRKGLQPIMQSQSEIKSLEDSLKSISTQEMRSSVKIFGDVLKRLATLPAASTDVSELLDEFGLCNRPPISDAVYLETKEVIQNTELLARSYQAIRNVDLSGLENDLKSLDEFIERIKFVGSGMDDTKNAELIEEMQKSDTKWNVTALLKRIQTKYEPLRDQKFEELAESLVQDKIKITGFQGNSEVADELTMFECLRKSADKSEKILNVFQAIRILRSLDPKDTDNVGQIASTITTSSSEFKTLKDIPESMWKKATTETERLNQMVDSMKNAAILGKAANGLRSAHQLGQMESSISLLKKQSDYVSDQISSVESPVLKTDLGNIWKDHSAGIDSLEAQFRKIEDIESKLNLANTTNLKKFGDSLKDLSGLSSVSWDVESDLEVVKALIPLATDKTNLEEVAAELEKFEALNLDFAGFQGAFDAAPSAFVALDTFVNGFLPLNLESSSLKSSSDNSALITLIASIVGAVVFLAILGAGFFFCVLPYIKTPSESDLQKWIRRQAFSTIAKAEKYHQKVYDLMNNEALIDKKASVAYLPVSKMRDPNVFCNPENAVKVKRDGKTIPIHANKITCPDGCVFIATQAPMDGKEPGKDNTLEDFIDMIMQQEAEFVVMLCNFEEGLFKCPEYIPPKGESLEIGRYKLTNTWQMKMSVDGLRTSLKIEDKNGQIPARAIVHFQYLEWPDHWLPIMPHTCVGILKMVNKSKKPIIVHCSTGTGRSVSFIAAEYISNAVSTRATATIAKVMDKLKTFRWHGIQNWTQSYYIQICVEYKLCLDFDLNMDDYQKQFTMQRDMIDEAAEKTKDEGRKSKMSAKSTPSTPTPKTPVTLKSKKSETDSDSRGGAGSDIAIQME